MQFDTSKYLEYLKPQSFGNHIIHIEETSSTNDEVWNHMTNHNDIIVITDKQTNGRGRRNNKWFSLESKSLTFSIGLIKKNKNNNLSPLIASLAICKSINQLSSMNVKIKWPNDIVINNKKIAGILIESKMIRGNMILNIGIGVNVNLNIEDITKILVFLKNNNKCKFKQLIDITAVDYPEKEKRFKLVYLLLNSVVPAFFIPAKFRAASTTAICIPKQIPKYGTCLSRANFAALILPSDPLSPNPPGIRMPFTPSRFCMVSLSSKVSDSSHLRLTRTLFAIPP